MTSQRMPIKVRDDMEVREIPEEDQFKGRSIALAYSSVFGGAGIQLTPFDALGLAQALFNAAMQRIESEQGDREFDDWIVKQHKEVPGGPDKH